MRTTAPQLTTAQKIRTGMLDRQLDDISRALRIRRRQITAEQNRELVQCNISAYKSDESND